MSAPTVFPTPMTRPRTPSPLAGTSGPLHNRRDDQHGADLELKSRLRPTLTTGPATPHKLTLSNALLHVTAFVCTRAKFGDTLLKLSGLVTLAGSASEIPEKKGITGLDC